MAVLLTARPRAWAAEPVPGVGPEERLKIEQAIPAKAPSTPKKPHKLLVLDLNVGYPGHRSIPHANLAITLMGKKTGVYETVVSRDPEVFRPQSLGRFDAVFLNNTVGNLFTDLELRRSLLDFVSSGGGLLGVHGDVAWPLPAGPRVPKKTGRSSPRCSVHAGPTTASTPGTSSLSLTIPGIP